MVANVSAHSRVQVWDFERGRALLYAMATLFEMAA
jgi:hypothetical protein